MKSYMVYPKVPFSLTLHDTSKDFTARHHSMLNISETLQGRALYTSTRGHNEIGPHWTNKGEGCKGVRCPPIFSLSNLINVGWLVRKCVDIYIL